MPSMQILSAKILMVECCRIGLTHSQIRVVEKASLHFENLPGRVFITSDGKTLVAIHFFTQGHDLADLINSEALGKVLT